MDTACRGCLMRTAPYPTSSAMAPKTPRAAPHGWAVLTVTGNELVSVLTQDGFQPTAIIWMGTDTPNNACPRGVCAVSTTPAQAWLPSGLISGRGGICSETTAPAPLLRENLWWSALASEASGVELPYAGEAAVAASGQLDTPNNFFHLFHIFHAGHRVSCPGSSGKTPSPPAIRCVGPSKRKPNVWALATSCARKVPVDWARHVLAQRPAAWGGTDPDDAHAQGCCQRDRLAVIPQRTRRRRRRLRGPVSQICNTPSTVSKCPLAMIRRRVGTSRLSGVLHLL